MDYNSFPVGIALSAMSMERYHGMTEAQKEDAIFRCRDAKNADEIDKILDSIEDWEAGGSVKPLDGSGIG